MTYGHAERNLALIRQLEAETRQLTVSSAAGRVPPSDEQLQGDDEIAPAFSQAVPDLDRGGRHEGQDELPSGLAREQAAAEFCIFGGTWLEKTAEFLPGIRSRGNPVIRNDVWIGQGSLYRFKMP
jgi:hypothetical protein